MRHLLDPENKVFAGIGVVGDHLLLGLLWVFCSIPVVTAGAAAAAVYSVSWRILAGERCRLVRDFFGAFRERFREKTLLWLPDLGVGLVLVFDLSFFFGLAADDVAWAGVALGGVVTLSLLFLACLLWQFPYIARYRSKIFPAIKFSFVLGVVNLGRTAAMLAAMAALAVLAVYFPWLLPFVPGISFLVNSALCVKAFEKLESKKKAGRAEGAQ